MANHGPSYGYSAECQAKQDSKYDRNLEAEVINWINSLVDAGLTPQNIREELKSGVILCNLANRIQPGTVRKVNTGKMPFVQMENINSFLVACKQFGVPDSDLFMTVDLFESKNMGQVVQTIHALGRHSQRVSGFSGPYIGSKLASANQRNFTEEQLRQGESTLPLQTSGSHGNANASGQFDSSREIVRGPGRRY